MNLEFAINKKTKGPYYIGYAPVACTLKIKDGAAGSPPVNITLSNNTRKGGQIEFYKDLNSREADTLTLPVPGDGKVLSFFIGGKFQAPSTEDGDAAINFVNNGNSLKIVPLMVRVRKDANNLTPGERDRFLSAFVKFLESGRYKNFLDMHNAAASPEIHGRSSFLPWHRMFVLDLERHLQAIDASVTIPYWNFQHPAPNVFTLDFMGRPSSTGVSALQFNSSNPLVNWHISGAPQLVRTPEFDTLTDKANVESETTTLRRGPNFEDFRVMEGNPHGSAHVSFSGNSPITNVTIAPRDPLFFMLHSNVDRLWATWQAAGNANDRIDPTDQEAYFFQGDAGAPGAQRIGDNVDDTLWPWDKDTARPRPHTAPGGPMINSPFTAFPGKTPKVSDAIDYQGKTNKQNLLFDYDTIPFIN